MPQFFLNKRLIILLISIILLVALIGYSIKGKDNISWPEKFIMDIVGFGQSLVSKPANGVAGFFENVADLKNTYKENKKLKKRLEELAKLEIEVNDLKKDNQDLRAIIGGKEKDLRDFETVQATVISRNPDRWQEHIVIDKGEVAGIKPNLAVITANGLLGKVISTAPMTAKVELLTANNPKTRISVIIQGEGEAEDIDRGIIEGYDMEKEMLILKRIPIDAEVKAGQKVITSGLGGVFPAGLPIGTVKETEPEVHGLTQTVYVKPAVKFNGLKHVMVVSRTMVEVDQETDKEVGAK